MTRPTTTGKAQDLITFTRSTTGTALAKISYGEELVTNGDFSTDSDWALTSYLSISNGKLNFNGVNTGFIGASQPVAFVSGKLYSISVDVESVTSGRWQVFVERNSGDLIINSELVAGSFTGNYVADGTEINLFISRNGATVLVATVNSISVKEVLYDQPDGTLQLFNHPINKPRIEYDASGNCLGLLVEEARTNLLTQSEFASGFTNSLATLTLNQATSPDTNINAASIVPNAANGEHFLEYILSSPSSGTYTQSVFVKANGYSKVALTPVHLGASQGATSTARFDLTEGTSTQSGSAVPYISNLGNGWYRIGITYTTTGTITGHRFRVQVLSDSYGYVWQANGADGIYVYGAQIEQGSFPTSYIPTSGSAVTRAADVASLALSKFGYNNNQSTILVEGEKTARNTTSTGVFTFVALHDGGINDRVLLYYNNTILRGQIKSANNVAAQLTSEVAEGGKLGLAYKENDVAFISNGGAVNTDTSAAMPAGLNTLAIGGYSYSTGQQINGHIKSVQYYPLRLSNAQLQALTV